MASTKKSTESNEPKDGDKLEYAGHTWRYSDKWRTWDLIGQSSKDIYLPPIYLLDSGRWACGDGKGKTPLTALKAYAKSEIGDRKRELRELEKTRARVKAEIKLLSSKSWKPKPRKPKVAVVSSKELSSKNLTARHYVKGKKK